MVRVPTRRSYLRRLAMLARRLGMAIAPNVTGAELDRAQDRIITFLGQMSSASLDAAVAEHLNEEFFEDSLSHLGLFVILVTRGVGGHEAGHARRQ